MRTQRQAWYTRIKSLHTKSYNMMNTNSHFVYRSISYGTRKHSNCTPKYFIMVDSSLESTRPEWTWTFVTHVYYFISSVISVVWSARRANYEWRTLRQLQSQTESVVPSIVLRGAHLGPRWGITLQNRFDSMKYDCHNLASCHTVISFIFDLPHIIESLSCDRVYSQLRRDLGAICIDSGLKFVIESSEMTILHGLDKKISFFRWA